MKSKSTIASRVSELARPVLIPVLAAFLFFLALIWAQSQDPFRRHWFKVTPSSGDEVACVAVFPKPHRACPVVLYLHDEGGSIKTDGGVLRKLAELGMIAISLDYCQTNHAQFEKQFSSVLRRVKHEGWAGPNSVAWMGEGLGTRHAVKFLSENPVYRPRVLAGLGWGKDTTLLSADLVKPPLQLGPNSSPNDYVWEDRASLETAISLVFVNDRGFGGPKAEGLCQCISNSIAVDVERQSLLQPRSRKVAQRAAAVVVNLTKIVVAPDMLLPNRDLVLRELGECCKKRLTPHNPQPEFSKPPEWPFLAFALPVVFCGALLEKRRLAHMGRSSSRAEPGPETKCSSQHKWSTLTVVSLLAGAFALVLVAWHAIPPQLKVTSLSLKLARWSVVTSASLEDFEQLAKMPIWKSEKVKTVVSHAELARYTAYKLVNWTMPPEIYEKHVLSPMIDSDQAAFDWRRPLWEYFYPRIRKENTTKAAATILVRNLRERVTISSSAKQSEDIEAIWKARITDPQGFERLYMAALRSVGVPARLNAEGSAEFWDGLSWAKAPRPLMDSID